MNILVVDSQGILSEQQTIHITNRLYFSLLKFEHRINGVTTHVSLDTNCEWVKCSINVNVGGSGVVSVKRSSRSSSDVIKQVLGAIEPKVARRVDWRAWFNSDRFATWLVSVHQRLNCLAGFGNWSSRTGNRSATISTDRFANRGSQRRPAAPRMFAKTKQPNHVSS